jgi:hypothetical protein
VDSRPDAERLDAALSDLRRALDDALGISRLVYWLDRQLRRSPRLYAWLSK